MKFKISGDLNLKKYQIEPKYDVTEKDWLTNFKSIEKAVT
jgi:hypothetical protein